MKIINYLVIYVLVLFMSCTDTESEMNLKVNIGEPKANIILKKFDPPKLVNNSNQDSLDVDGDSRAGAGLRPVSCFEKAKIICPCGARRGLQNRASRGLTGII